jgi:hypothetical protein
MSAASLSGIVELQQAQSRGWSQLMAALLLAALSAAGTGCASPGSAAANDLAPVKPPPLDKTASEPRKPATMDEDPAAAQARRELEELQAISKQKQIHEFAAGTPAGGPKPPPLSAEKPPPVIVWNDANGGVSIAGPIHTKVPDPHAKTDLSRMPSVVLVEGDEAPSREAGMRGTTPAGPAQPTGSPLSLTANATAASAKTTPTDAASGQGFVPTPPPALPSDDAGHLQLLLVQLSRELYQQAADEDTPLRELIVIAATTMVSSDRPFNPDALPGLTERERQLLAEMHQFFLDLGEKLKTSGDPEVIPAAVESLRARLKVEPELQLANAALASSVEGFGKMRVFEPAKFLAHSEQKVIVYVEVDKFASEANEQGEYVTELAQQLVIYSDRDGIPVWQEDWQTAVDRTRAKRQDFFMRQIVTLPKALSVGPYHMKVRVRDRKSGAEAEASIPFEMVADPKMAATVQ